MTNEIIFRVEEYTDINSNNTCEIFSVYFIGERDGTSIKRKVWERDYGSQTESIEDYIIDYLNREATKQAKPQEWATDWVATSTH